MCQLGKKKWMVIFRPRQRAFTFGAAAGKILSQSRHMPNVAGRQAEGSPKSKCLAMKPKNFAPSKDGPLKGASGTNKNPADLS